MITGDEEESKTLMHAARAHFLPAGDTTDEDSMGVDWQEDEFQQVDSVTPAPSGSKRSSSEPPRTLPSQRMKVAEEKSSKSSRTMVPPSDGPSDNPTFMFGKNTKVKTFKEVTEQRFSLLGAG